MKNKNKKGMPRSVAIFLKSAVLTLAAISLVAIGYFGAEYLSGIR